MHTESKGQSRGSSPSPAPGRPAAPSTSGGASSTPAAAPPAPAATPAAAQSGAPPAQQKQPPPKQDKPTRAERRAVQEAQKAAKAAKKVRTPLKGQARVLLLVIAYTTRPALHLHSHCTALHCSTPLNYRVITVVGVLGSLVYTPPDNPSM
jgi:hypothetical protein